MTNRVFVCFFFATCFLYLFESIMTNFVFVFKEMCKLFAIIQPNIVLKLVYIASTPQTGVHIERHSSDAEHLQAA